MKVLGIDPGTAACGYGIVIASGGRVQAVDFGWGPTPAGQRPELRLKQIHDEVAELIARHEEEAENGNGQTVEEEERFAFTWARGKIFISPPESIGHNYDQTLPRDPRDVKPG